MTKLVLLRPFTLQDRLTGRKKDRLTVILDCALHL